VDSIKVISRWVFTKSIKLHLFLIFGLLLLTALITLQKVNYQSIAPRALIVYLLLIISIYNGRWLCHRFLLKNRWWQLILLGVVTIGLISVTGIVGMLYQLGYTDGDLSGFIVITPLLVTVAVFAGSIASIVRVLLRQQQTEATIMQYQKEAEIKQLTERISPHFLFNALNNLYGLSINYPQKVPVLLLQLSDLLRYNVYVSNKDFVFLDDELAHMQNYIALEEIRLKDRLKLTLQMSNTETRFKIAPLILMTFVENAFKHAKQSFSETIEVRIKLHATMENIYFSVSNSCSDKLENGQKSEPQFGFGLPTVIQRLNLLYPDAHTLTFGKKGRYYEVDLKLQSRA
jgi:two-component system LytT family sensor kinase